MLLITKDETCESEINKIIAIANYISKKNPNKQLSGKQSHQDLCIHYTGICFRVMN